MVDILFLAALTVVLIQNRLPVLAAAGIVVCVGRGLAGWLAARVKFKQLELAILLFLAYWLANYFWSTADLDNLVSYEFLRRDGALFVTYPTFFFLLQWRLRRSYFRGFWLVFLSVLSILAVFAALLLQGFSYANLLEPLSIVGSEAEFMGSRLFYGWYNAHDAAGAVYTMGCVILLALLVEGKLGRAFRNYLWIMFFCCLGGLALTFSRSGYVSLMAGMFVLLPLRHLRNTFKIGLAVIVPLIVVLLSNSAVLNRIDTITDPNWGTNASRFVVWRDALHDFSQSPIIGIGLGRYNDLGRFFKGVPGLVYVATSGEIENNDSTAHNSYLHFLAEGGIAGLFVSMFIWWSVWKELSFFERKLPRSHLHPFHRAAKGALAATLVYCMFDHALGSGSGVLILMTLVGITLAASRAEWLVVSKARPKPPAQPAAIRTRMPVGAVQFVRK
ncbi:MAG: O-antigen ligase family protein [Terriglobia bacterium]